MWKRSILFIALGICSPLLRAQNLAASAVPVPPAPGVSAKRADPPRFAQRNPRYQIRPSDVIEFSFYPAAELNQTVTVQPDGYITLREAGDVHVEGKTIAELQDAVQLAYGKILNAPVITIVLRDFEKPHFTVGGEVGHPGKFELRADTTAAEGVAIAGGITEKAKHSQVLLFRRVSDDWVEVKQLDMKAIMKGNWSEDVHLRPGDMLFVPQNRFSKIKPFLPIWTLGTYTGSGVF